MARIAFVLADDYEDSEFRQPYDAVRERGHEAVVIGKESGKTVKGKRGDDSVEVERTAQGARIDEFDALVIAGGYSPDKLRLDRDIVDFTSRMMKSGKPVAAICHAPQLLVEAEAARGRTLTGWPSVRKDVENAGGKWVDREVVEDDNLITSRKPDDLDAFCRTLLARLG